MLRHRKDLLLLRCRGANRQPIGAGFDPLASEFCVRSLWKTDEMEIRIRSLDDLVVVEAIGKITIDSGSTRIHETIRKLVGQGQSRLVVDLSRVDYMDSTGVGNLVASYTTTINSGGRVVLLNANEKVEYLLNMTNLLKVFEIFQDEHELVASFSG